MSETLYAATRKGLFTMDPGAAGWGIARTSFLGDPVTALLPDPRDGTLYAGLNLGHFGVKLHRSEDGGASWKELPTPAFPAASGDKEAPSVSLIWTLAAGGPDQPGLLWAGTLPGGLFRSADRGESWSLVESLWHVPERREWFGGGYDDPGIHSICVDPRDSRTLTVGVSCGGVWTSADGGESWTLGGTGLRADYMPPNLADDRHIQDPHLLARCEAAPDRLWCQHHNGIFRSDDGGGNFIEITAATPSAFGFAVAAHPADPDTAWFVPAVKDECRVPVDGRFVVTRTKDGGESFEALSDGLPQGAAYDLVYRHALAIDGTGGRLAMGSTTGSLWGTDDGGESWMLASANMPPINQVIFG